MSGQLFPNGCPIPRLRKRVHKILKTDFYKLSFAVRRSIRYHAKRRAWYDGLHSAAMVTAAIAGSTTFATIVAGSPEIAKWLALVVAIASVMDTMLNWPEKARTHDALYRRFHDLEQVINESDELSEKRLNKLQNQRLQIEVDEPTTIDALNIVCRNIQAQAQGHPRSELTHIRWYQRLFCNILTLPPNDFE